MEKRRRLRKDGSKRDGERTEMEKGREGDGEKKEMEKGKGEGRGEGLACQVV